MKLNKDLLQVIAVSTILGIVFLLYILTIGQRMTQSRTEYISGYESYKSEDNTKAVEFLKKSNELWPNNDAAKLIEQIEEEN